MLAADRTFFNGNIYTMTSEGDQVNALVVYDEKIIFAGSNEEALEFPAKSKVDLKGKTVLPGFTDTHLHFMMDCEFKQSVNLVDANSIDDIIKRMKEREKELVDGQWLIGARMHIERLKEQRYPVRQELDLISKDRPIIVKSYCEHAVIANSKAMELAGIGKGFVPKIKGTVEFDENGLPTGITRETLFAEKFAPLIGNVLGDPGVKKAAIIKNLEEYSSKGLTTIHTFSALSGDPEEYIYTYKELDEEDKLPLRVIINSTVDLPRGFGAVSGFGNDKIKFGAKKIFCDGSLVSRSAALMEPYSDAKDQYGIAVYNQDELNQQIKEAYDYGMEVAAHAIGDRGIEMVLTAIENAYDPKAEHKNRFRLIHAILPKQDQIERMKKLPLILDVQPIFIRNWVGPAAEQRVGPDRVKLFLPFRTYIDNGLCLTGGTDAPVEDVNPLFGIQCAVTRQDLNGFPEEGFLPEQAVSVYEAVSMFTKNAAYCTNEETIRGTLENGKRADLIVLSQDIFKVPHHNIHKIRVENTVLGGRTVFSLKK